jgi:MoaA/NifB/PqqE/SkfB family radical SAM enzyme
MKKDLENKLDNYSFCLFRIPEEGGRALWEVTNSCNYSCPYCIFSAEKGKIEGELTTEEVYSTLEGLKSRGFTHIKYTGGEPFIRKDFVDILKKTSELGLVSDVSTNASLITEKKAEEMKHLDLKMIHVSLDGPDKETHESARGEKTYEPTIRGIKNLVKNDIYVRLGTVIFKDNENKLEETVQKAADLRVDEIIFSFMEPVGRMEGDDSQVSYRPIDEVKKELDSLAERYNEQVKVNYSFTEDPDDTGEGRCPGATKFLYIDNLGRASPCTWVVEQSPEYRTTKTFKDSGFEEVMDSEPINDYLSHVDELQGKGCKGCPARIRKK